MPVHWVWPMRSGPRSPALSPIGSVRGPAVLVQSIAGGLGLVSLVTLTDFDVPWPVLAVAAGLAGLVMPQVGFGSVQTATSVLATAAGNRA